MDPPGSGYSLSAPGVPSAALRFPSQSTAQEQLPEVDESVLGEDVRAEILDGVVYETMGADEPHGRTHFEVPGVLRSCLSEGYLGAADMLTRPERKSNFAPDVSIYPRERNLRGHRRVEEIVIEIRDTQSRENLERKVKKLKQRGVRRVFMIETADHSVHEWRSPRGDWERLEAHTLITDPCFVQPVPAGALVDALLADDTVARALITRGNRVLRDEITSGEARGEARGEAKGLRVALVALCEVLNLQLDLVRQEAIACADADTLSRWIEHVRAHRAWPLP